MKYLLRPPLALKLRRRINSSKETSAIFVTANPGTEVRMRGVKTLAPKRKVRMRGRGVGVGRKYQQLKTIILKQLDKLLTKMFILGAGRVNGRYIFSLN